MKRIMISDVLKKIKRIIVITVLTPFILFFTAIGKILTFKNKMENLNVNPDNDFVIVKETEYGNLLYWNEEDDDFEGLEYATLYPNHQTAKIECDNNESGKVKQLTNEEQKIFSD